MGEDEEVIKKDYLLKRSQMKKWYSGENFKHRWFWLFPSVLKYYDGSLEGGKEKLKGSIHIPLIKVIEKLDDDALAMPNAFQVVYLEDALPYSLYCVCNFENQRDEWVQKLRDACAACRSELWDYYHPGAWKPKTGAFSCCDQLSRTAKGCKVATATTNNNTKKKERTRSRTSSTDTPRPTPVKKPVKSAPDRTAKPGAGSTSTLGNGGGRRAPPPLPVNEPEPVAAKAEPIKKCVALYDYTKVESDDLALIQGEEYEIIDDFSQQHWWEVRNKNGETGFIPVNYVEVVTEGGIELFGWYFKGVTRGQAEKILVDEDIEGCFLVRDSSQPGKYTLTLYTRDGGQGGVVRHYQLKKDAAGLHYFSEKHKYPELAELIDYHKKNSSGLATRLRCPPSKQKERIRSKGSVQFLREGKWNIEQSDLEIGMELGRGEFGAVYKGKWKNSIDVAIKMIKPGSMSNEEFLQEAKTMTKLQHPNLVQLYGVCQAEETLYIVTEFMKNGALNMYLRRQSGMLLRRPSQPLDMAIQVCGGMVYLEKQNIIHRDLAARNCLVGENNIIQVADFGLARFVVDDEYTATGHKFPIRWAPPEVLQTARFSSKSDVWSLGVLMWEIFSGGMMPYGPYTKNPQVYKKVVHDNYRLERPKACPEIVYEEIMMPAWNEHPEDRPTFNELLREMEMIQEEM